MPFDYHLRLRRVSGVSPVTGIDYREKRSQYLSTYSIFNSKLIQVFSTPINSVLM